MTLEHVQIILRNICSLQFFLVSERAWYLPAHNFRIHRLTVVFDWTHVPQHLSSFPLVSLTVYKTKSLRWWRDNYFQTQITQQIVIKLWIWYDNDKDFIFVTPSGHQARDFSNELVLVYYVPRRIMRVITRRVTMLAGNRSQGKTET